MNGLYDFFRTDLQPELIKHERKRKLVIRDSHLIFIVAFILASIPIINSIREIGLEHSLIGIPVMYIPAFAIAFFLRRGLIRLHKRVVKQVTIAKVVHYVDSELEYRAQASVSRKSVVSSGLFGFLPSDFNMQGEDRITGQLDGLGFSCSEISMKSEHLLSDNLYFKDLDFLGMQIFRGLFAEIELPQHTDSLIYIYPNRAKNNIGNTLKDNFVYSGNTAVKLERVKVEDSVFERHFNVFANDQLQSRMILTTALIADITRFREKMNTAIMLCIKGSKLYIAVPSLDLFEPNVSESYLNPDYIRQYIKELQMVTELVKDVRDIFR